MSDSDSENEVSSGNLIQQDSPRGNEEEQKADDQQDAEKNLARDDKSVSDDDDDLVETHKKVKRIRDDDEDEEEEDGGDNDDDDERETAKDKDDEDREDDKDQQGRDDKPARDDEDEEEEQVEEEEEEERVSSQNHTIYDFDIMMAKKKEENSRKRRRRNYDIINDNDDIIADIINQMKDAVEADSEANKNKQAATKKLKLLPFVISQLRKVDLRDAFLDSDVLSVITEWLAPLPDRSLPHLNIRESLLKILIDFNLYDVDKIKGSGIGKAIMYLYKHPKETKENKQRAKQLISSWSRPIFQLDSSFTAISREEREQRDLELMSKQRRSSKQNDSSDGEGAAGPSGSGKKTKEEVAQKPGDKGWIPRARVPAPSMKDYVIRPRSKVDADIGKSSKRPANMLEKYMKSQQERRRASRQQRAINMKIDRV